jgi:predicted ATPase/DNA-binding SARP family transcriptional activator
VLTIRTLGNFDVHISNSSLAENSSLTERVETRRELLLVYLAEQGRPQSRVDIAKLLWPAVDKLLASNSLRVMLSRTRQQHTSPLLHITRQTLAIASSAKLHYDAAQVRAVARDLAAANEAMLRQTADLYRGPFLASIPLDDYRELDEWATTIRAEVEVSMVRILQRLLALMLHSHSDPAAAVRYAQQLVELVPDDDEVQGTYLQALAANGELAQALQHYTRYRRSLQDERDVGNSLKALVAQLRRPRYAADLTATAYEALDGGLVGGDEAKLDMRFPAIEHPLIGRQQESALLSKLLTEGHRLISVTGLGGAGKSFFVRSQLDNLQTRFGSRLYFVNLQDHTVSGDNATDLLIHSIVAALGFVPRAGQPLVEQVVKALHGPPCCLILDSFEAVKSASPMVSNLLQSLPQLTIIITSRIRLQLLSEVSIYLDGLACDSAVDDAAVAESDQNGAGPGAGAASGPQEIERAESDAVRLFLHCIQRRQPHFGVDDSKRELIRTICQQVGGLPLAIELAAIQLEFYSLPELAESLSKDITLLSAEIHEARRDHQSIQALLDGMWQSLDLEAQHVLAGLSIFNTVWHREAMLAVVPAPQSIYRALINASLVRVEDSGWFSLHPLVRAYAATQLRQQDHAAEVAQRHAAYVSGTQLQESAD